MRFFGRVGRKALDQISRCSSVIPSSSSCFGLFSGKSEFFSAANAQRIGGQSMGSELAGFSTIFSNLLSSRMVMISCTSLSVMSEKIGDLRSNVAADESGIIFSAIAVSTN